MDADPTSIVLDLRAVIAVPTISSPTVRLSTNIDLNDDIPVA